MYTLLVCADLYGEKCNYELSFPSIPTIAELQKQIVTVFSAEAKIRRPSMHPVVEFSIARVQIYDDKLQGWVNFVSTTQLHEYDQLYVFQPQSAWHTDVQMDLPPPCPPTQSRAASVLQSIANSPPKSTVLTQQIAYRSETPTLSLSSGMVISPTKMRLEEQRRRERALREELTRVREESERLEREAAIEEEELRAREQEQIKRVMRQKEDEIRRQRDRLSQSEEEFRQLQSEKYIYI